MSPAEFARAHGAPLSAVPQLAALYGFVRNTGALSTDPYSGRVDAPRWAGTSAMYGTLPAVDVEALRTAAAAHNPLGAAAARGQPRGPVSTGPAPTLSPAQLSEVQADGYYRLGGGFTVAGHGGPDSQEVQFMASPGEKVVVVPAGEGVLDFVRRNLPRFQLGGVAIVDPGAPGALASSNTSPNPAKVMNAVAAGDGLAPGAAELQAALAWHRLALAAMARPAVGAAGMGRAAVGAPGGALPAVELPAVPDTLAASSYGWGGGRNSG